MQFVPVMQSTVLQGQMLTGSYGQEMTKVEET